MQFAIFFFLLPFGGIRGGLAQTIPHQAKTFTLNDNTLNGTTHDYQARDYIQLQHGFQYSAQPGQWLHAGINKDLVLPVDYAAALFDDNTFDRDINPLLPVGATPGSAGVSPTGAATYTIPIYVPPGTAGMQPNLSIVYNSQGGNGLLGMGWNLAGLSSITRVNQTIDPNFKVEAIHFDGDDRFALDGNRLILATGTYGSPNATYTTEVEAFSVITSNGTIGNGPLYFTVETKSGLIMRYGYNDYSRMQDTPTDPVLVWFIDRIEDQYGNYMLFEYSKDGDGLRIKEIKYTGNSTQDTYNSIKFYYEKRQDINTIFVNGAGVNKNLLLNKIEVTSEGQNVKKYIFKYGFNIVSYLMEIEERGSDNTPLNSTLLEYGNEGQFIEQPITSLPLYSESVSLNCTIAGVPLPLLTNTFYDYLNIDFNGDGKDDIIDFPHTHTMNCTYPLTSTATKVTPELNINQDGINFSPSPFAANVPVDYFPVIPGNNNVSLYYKKGFIKSFDLNGDERDDLILGAFDNSDGDIILSPYISDGNNFVQQNNTFTIPYYYPYTFGDFDGNGTLDVMYAQTDLLVNIPGSGQSTLEIGGYASMYFFDQQHKTSSINFTATTDAVNEIPIGSNTFVQNVKLYPLDLNGDGKTEIMTLINGGNAYIHEFHGPYANITSEEIYSGGFPSYDDIIQMGDFNGDGKTDLLVWDESASSWQIGYSTGAGFNTVSFPLTLFPPEESGVAQSAKHFIIDINGDGYSDVLEITDIIQSGVGREIHILYCNGIFFSLKTQFINTGISNDSEFLFGDFNGDGKQDLAITGAFDFNIIYFDKDDRSNLLYKTLDGHNLKTTFTYEPLSTGGAFYPKGNSAVYPVADYQGPLHAVSYLTVPDGVGGEVTTTYTYENARYNKWRKEFIGFTKITEENNNTGIKKLTFYELLQLYSFPMVSHVQTFSDDGTLILEIFNQNNLKWTYTPAFFPFVENETLYDYLRDKTVTTQYAYDSNGNLTQQVTDYGGKETVNLQYNNYIQKGSTVPNVPETLVTTRKRFDDPLSYTVTTNFSYTNEGKPYQKTDFAGLAKKITTTFSYYNNTGNLLSATASAGSDDRTTAYQYDIKGRFVTKTNNPLNQTSETEYHARWGKPVKEKGINGLVTTYEYDAFGRLAKMKTPDDLQTIYERKWDIDNALHSLYYDMVTPEGAPSVKKWSDIYGREVKTQTEGFNNNAPVFILQTYNNKGQLTSKTLPFYSVETPVTTNYYYVLSGLYQGMLESETTAAQTTSNNYSASSGHYTVSITDPANQTSSTTTDASGKVISATDNGGTTLLYTYFSNGQSNDIKFSGQTDAISSMTYDDRGFQTTLYDANAGTITYEYNAYSELVTQIDAKGTYTMTYNKLGQILTREHSVEGTTTWLYYPVGSAINQPRIITAPNGNRQSFTYDNLGRLTSLTEIIDNIGYTTSYQYNNLGHVSKIIYPSGFSVSHNYDQYGHGYLTEVQNASDNSLYWQGITMNARSQYTKYLQGDGCYTEKTFDVFGRTSLIKAGKNSPDYNNIQQLQLGWNLSTGNLNVRYDGVNMENFTYDNLNRLKTMHVTGQTPVSLNYSNNGNIQDKSDLGSYVYSSTAPNAVEKIWCGTVPYAPQQDITYTAFNKTATITESDYELAYTYGPDQQRRKSVLTNTGTGNIEKTIIYAGSFEKITVGGNTYEVHYIAGGSGLTAINVRHNGSDQMFYVYTDHLGSILKLTDASGKIVFEQNFDAWGRKRNPEDWTYDMAGYTPPTLPAGTFDPAIWLIRGFTGHEHLPEFALINMNGRMYDPVIGRVLSPDNFVNLPKFTQSYNRYSYALNNPLKYYDPTGQNENAIEFIGTWDWYGGGGYSYNWDPFGAEQMQWRYYSLAALFIGGGGDNPFLSPIQYSGGSFVAGAESFNIASNPYYLEPIYGTAWTEYPGYPQYTSYQGTYIKGYERVDANIEIGQPPMGGGVGSGGLSTAFVGAGLATGSKIYFDPKGGTWTGKNFKTYSTSWGGNQYTGGKYKFAQKVSTGFKIGGYGLGLYNAYSIEEQYRSGQISETQRWIEQGSNVITTIGSIWGAAWGIGWELGRIITQTDLYRENIKGEYISKPYECVLCPK